MGTDDCHPINRGRCLKGIFSFLSGPLVSIATTVILLLLIEGFSRWFLPEVSDTFVVNAPSYKERYHHSCQLSERISPPGEADFRIMFLGDSFTLGFCDPAYSFPNLVQEYYRKALLPGVGPRKIQSYNLGCSSYSPSIYAVVLRDYAPVIKPDLVVIAVDDSDPQDDFIYREMVVKDQDNLPLSVYPGLLYVPAVARPLARELKIVRLFFHAFSRSRSVASHEEEDYLSAQVNRYGHYRSEELGRWTQAFSRSMGLIEAMVRYCRGRGIKIVLINYPYAPAVTTEFNTEWRRKFSLGTGRVYEPAFHSFQRDYALSRQIPYYDFTDFLRSLPELDGIYNEEDGHFSAEGNILFAGELVKFIEKAVFNE